MTRALAEMDQIQLAKKSGVSIGTIRHMESFSGAISSNAVTIRKVQIALEKAGIEFLNHGEPGVKIRRH